MKFYNREIEKQELINIRNLSYESHSKLTVITGRRRVGKTSLILHALDDEPFLYFFVGRKSEADLCDEYVKEISLKLNIFVPTMDRFSDIFRFLMEQGVQKKFTLVIDEFQEFINVNESVYSDIQNFWDQYRIKSHINFLVSGSIYSLMVKIFQDKKEPLFGRADSMIKVKPFNIDVLKEILNDYKPGYENDELLALYTFTGGIPKYVELLVDNTQLTIPGMIRFLCKDSSPFLDEGRHLLIQEFGKKYGTYFSILSAIGRGMNTQSEIEAHLGEKSLGGQLFKLEDVYEVITKTRPIFSKEGSHTVRYEINDNFLRFWFRYIESNQSLLEIGNNEGLMKIIENDYATYSGKTLELYFKQKLAESQIFRNIGSLWEPKGDQNEIDIVAVSLFEKKVLIVEVKRQRKNFKPQAFEEKVLILKKKELNRYDIETVCWDLTDM